MGGDEMPGSDIRTLRAEIANVMQHITALDRRVTELRSADQEAVRIALDTLKERLSLLNELRQVVLDQSRDFARAKEVEQQLETIKKDVDALEKQLSSQTAGQLASVSSATETRVMVLGGVSLVVGVVLAGIALLTWLR